MAAATGTHDDLPDLIALSNSDDSDEDGYRNEALNNEWLWEESNMPPSEGASSWDKETPQSDDLNEMAMKLVEVLTACQPFPGDVPPINPTYELGDPWFEISYAASAFELHEIYDCVQGFGAHIHLSHLCTPEFSIGGWYVEQCAFNKDLPNPWEVAQRWAEARQEQDLIMGELEAEVESAVNIDIGGVQVDCNKYPALQRNSVQIKVTSGFSLSQSLSGLWLINDRYTHCWTQDLLETSYHLHWWISYLSNESHLRTIVLEVGCTRIQVQSKF